MKTVIIGRKLSIEKMQITPVKPENPYEFYMKTQKPEQKLDIKQ